MINLTESDIALIYLLVDSELQNVNESGQNMDAYAKHLESILNKIAEGEE
jgi:hypothetical protein